MTTILIWYVCLQAFGAGGSVLASRWLGGLGDRGYAIGKALGLALGALLYWYAVLIGFAPNGAGASLLALAGVWVLAIGLPLRQAPQFPRPLVVLMVEAVFALFYLAGAMLRAYQPDITPAGGEKFMESMMIHAIARSAAFPPNDAWLSGYSLSYYYFGYVLIAMLAHLSGIAPTVAFNLSSAAFIALAACSIFGVSYALGCKLGASTAERSGLFAGMLSVVALMLMGNLGAALGALYCAGALPRSFWEWLDVRNIATQSFSCDGFVPASFYGWWWNWSRVVQDIAPDGRRLEVITETPIFSFVLGDIHPHVIHLPFALFILGAALATAHEPPLSWRTLRSADSYLRIGLLGAVLASTLFMNAWDFPAAMLTLLAAFLLRQRQEKRCDVCWADWMFLACALLTGLLLSTPWQITFDSQVRGVAPNVFFATRLAHFVAMFVPLLFVAVLFVAFTLAQAQLPIRNVVGFFLTGLALLLLVVLGSVVAGLLSPDIRELVFAVARGEPALGFSADQLQHALVRRLLNPWTALTLLVLATSSAVILASRRLSAATRFTAALLGTGAVLALSVEFVFVRDLFGTRMNTVFKLYYQTWWLWAAASGGAVVWLWQRRSIVADVSIGVALALFALGALWAPMAAYARTEGFQRSPTLDGIAYLQRSHREDAALIRWLNAHVVGDARIVEASTLGAYEHTGRIAAFTGLPTALGWGGHQHQWRGDITLARERHALVEQIYQTEDPQTLRRLLQTLDAKYVIVGELELTQFGEATHTRIAAACEAVFRFGSSAIYRCA